MDMIFQKKLWIIIIRIFYYISLLNYLFKHDCERSFEIYNGLLYIIINVLLLYN